ncbi:MAG: SRPBCC family protein [Actinobacteria bacterium]|nr:SRPBCC family protein [Actinomycetota bacterium]
MPDYEVSVDIAVPPETAWALLRDPSGISQWHPDYVRSHPVRDVRVLERADGTKVQERFISCDDDEFALVSRVTGGLPVEGHMNVFLVKPLHPGCRVTWWTRAEPDASGLDPGTWIPAEHHRALLALRDYLEDQ